jgi:hypothetical protein
LSLLKKIPGIESLVWAGDSSCLATEVISLGEKRKTTVLLFFASAVIAEVAIIHILHYKMVDGI